MEETSDHEHSHAPKGEMAKCYVVATTRQVLHRDDSGLATCESSECAKRNKMKDENTWNTICPVCGSPIRPEMLLVELATGSEGHQHQDQTQRGIRLCSKECAETAERSPQKYQAAAASNSVAGE